MAEERGEAKVRALLEAVHYIFFLEDLYRFLSQADIHIIDSGIIPWEVTLSPGEEKAIVCRLPKEPEPIYCIGTFVEVWTDKPEYLAWAFYVDGYTEDRASVNYHKFVPNVSPNVERRLHETFWVKKEFGYIKFVNLSDTESVNVRMIIDKKLIKKSDYEKFIKPYFQILWNKIKEGVENA